jgi:hypothetical protein
MKKARPKTGEPRRAKQPLLIDRLPSYVHDVIVKKRSEGVTYPQIEEQSREFVNWDELAPMLVAKFPGQKLPKSNIHRWYDLRVAQVVKETLIEAEQARQVATAFASAAVSGSDEAVINAARDLIFGMLREKDKGTHAKTTKALLSLADIMQRARANDIKQRKVELEGQRVELVRAKLLGLKNDVKKKQLSPEELQKKLDDIYGITEG